MYVCIYISYFLNGKSYTMWSKAYLYITSVCMTKFFTPSMNINFEQHHQNSVTVLGLLWCWQGSFRRHCNGCIWSIIPHCLLWCLWRERNSRRFEDTERSIPNLKLLFFRTLRDWLFALQNKSFPSFIDFLESCNLCLWFLFPCTLPVH